jgi:predicted short-subunit dehydrogenase-like oxidoreductase (DUF2520 family)
MANKPSIAIVGVGNLGTVLALQLHGAGYKISELVSRRLAVERSAQLARKLRASAKSLKRAHLSAGVIWLCVPDREIGNLAKTLAATHDWRGKIAIHSSGALTSDELAPLRLAGAAVASVHPLMTFVAGVNTALTGVPFAVEGDGRAVRAVRRIVADLGGESFVINKENKVAYHAWGAFASPLIVALLATAETVARRAGIAGASARNRVVPILRQTIENYAQKGPAGAFSGPLIRGDVRTVQQHLKLLRSIPEAEQVYLALAKSAISNLPVKNRAEMREALHVSTGRGNRKVRQASMGKGSTTVK